MALNGQCICGAVSFAVDSAPVFQGYCHCDSCQRSQSAPLVAVAMFARETVRLTGETRTRTVTGRDGAAVRVSCAECGSRVANIPSGAAGSTMMALFPALFNDKGWFEPSLHIFCNDRVIDVQDDLPKYLDLPAEFGGSGDVVAH